MVSPHTQNCLADSASEAKCRKPAPGLDRRLREADPTPLPGPRSVRRMRTNPGHASPCALARTPPGLALRPPPPRVTEPEFLPPPGLAAAELTRPLRQASGALCEVASRWASRRTSGTALLEPGLVAHSAALV